MITGVATFGYVAAAFAFFVLVALLITTWRGRQVGGALLLASIFSAVWAGIAAYQASSGYSSSIYMLIAEALRDVSWLVFLFLVISKAREQKITALLLRVGGSLVVAVILIIAYMVLGGAGIPYGMGFGIQAFSFLVLSILGLMLVEQIFRNTSLESRWAIKYLCLGLGGVFAFDFYLYSEAFLLKNIDENVWGARGYVNAIVVPLIAISAARNPQWSFDVFVSRSFVFHSAAMMGGGVYLLAMAGGGYYIKYIGGDWSGLGQLVFFFGAILILLVILFSGHMRARVRVFLNKHFFSYRYDYREEWLRLIQSLSEAQLDSNLKTTVIIAMAKIVDSPGGMLWLQQDKGNYQLVASWNMPDEITSRQDENESLLTFLAEHKWVIDLDELETEQESYPGLVVPSWLSQLVEAWLVVPLFMGPDVLLSTSGGRDSSSVTLGFIVLPRSRAKMQINWEVRDLLLTTGRQCAGYLALLKANEDLMDARQFEAFNQLSAYVVHDLKNIVAQLSLIVSNADRHRDTPAFVDDAFSTIKNATAKMNRMLTQLRQGREDFSENSIVVLDLMLTDLVQQYSIMQPAPQFISAGKDLAIIANADRFSAVIGHLIQNAQDATQDDGSVRVSVCQEGEYALLLIQDTGCGMDKMFIRERLFRPFDTTKGNAGMGIGVYESREFINNLGGEIDVHSEPGKGTTFFIRLRLSHPNSAVSNELTSMPVSH